MKYLAPIVAVSVAVFSGSALAASGDASLVHYPVGFSAESNAAPLTRAQVQAQLTFEHAEATRGDMPHYPAGVAIDPQQPQRSRAQVNLELTDAAANRTYQNVETDYPGSV